LAFDQNDKNVFGLDDKIVPVRIGRKAAVLCTLLNLRTQAEIGRLLELLVVARPPKSISPPSHSTPVALVLGY